MRLLLIGLFACLGDAKLLRIAMYNGSGASIADHDYPYIPVLKEAASALTENATFEILQDTHDVQAKLTLDNFDLVLFPGGMGGSLQARGLGEDGMQKVRDFVSAGGGYIGTCAGAFLGLGWLKLYGEAVDAQSLGEGPIKLGFTNHGLNEFPALDRNVVGSGKRVNIYYEGGPVIMNPLPATVHVLASYLTDVPGSWKNPAKGLGTPAITYGQYGKGRVVLNSPHPEHVKSQPGSGVVIYRGELAWALRLTSDENFIIIL